MLEARIDGAAALYRVAAQMRAQGCKDLSRQMADALERATRPVQAAITASAEATMPSGYGPTFVASLTHRRSRRTAGQRAQIILRTYADGQVQRRDIRRLEAGELRHPLWGHRGRQWYVTRIQPGFHRRGTDGAADAARAELVKVVADFAQKLIE
jgi:hypothetical protein